LDFHVVLTIGEYAFKRIATGWFIRLLAVTAVVLLLVLFQGGVDPQETLTASRATALDIMTIGALLLVIIMGATEIPRDIDTRTILIILSKPLTKSDIVVGKFVGLVYVSFFTILFLGATILIGGMLRVQLDGLAFAADANFFQKCGFAFCQSVVVAAMAILLSTQLGEIPIIFLTALYAMIGFVVANLYALVAAKNLPLVVQGALLAIYYAFPDMRYFQLPGRVQEAGSVSWTHFGLAFVYAAIYSSVLLQLAMRSFKRREVAG